MRKVHTLSVRLIHNLSSECCQNPSQSGPEHALICIFGGRRTPSGREKSLLNTSKYDRTNHKKDTEQCNLMIEVGKGSKDGAGGNSCRITEVPSLMCFSSIVVESADNRWIF